MKYKNAVCYVNYIYRRFMHRSLGQCGAVRQARVRAVRCFG